MSEALARLVKVSETIPGMIEKLLFVGGGVTEFLVTNTGGRKPRQTFDLDCVVEVATRHEYHDLEKRLRKAGFINDPEIPPTICRWVLDEVILDVMPTIESILGFSNRWYPEAIKHPMAYGLPNGIQVNIISPVFFLATKTEAFLNRGKGDMRASHDFEDILFVVNGREGIVEEMRMAPPEVMDWMKRIWTQVLDSADFKAAIIEHLDAYEASARSPVVLKRFREMFGKGT